MDSAQRTAFESTYHAILRGRHVIVSELFLDWLLAEHPDDSARTRVATNKAPLGTHDTFVAFIGPIPADAEFVRDGKCLMNGQYINHIVAESSRA